MDAALTSTVASLATGSGFGKAVMGRLKVTYLPGLSSYLASGPREAKREQSRGRSENPPRKAESEEFR